MNKDRITKVPLHDVRQNEANPRTITPENLKRLMLWFAANMELLARPVVRSVADSERQAVRRGGMERRARRHRAACFIV